MEYDNTPRESKHAVLTSHRLTVVWQQRPRREEKERNAILRQPMKDYIADSKL